MYIPQYKYVRKRKQNEGERVEGIFSDGITKMYRTHKRTPKGCSIAHRVCIACLKVRIHGNSKYYESKICEACTNLKRAPVSRAHAPTNPGINRAHSRLVNSLLTASRLRESRQ